MQNEPQICLISLDIFTGVKNRNDVPENIDSFYRQNLCNCVEQMYKLCGSRNVADRFIVYISDHCIVVSLYRMKKIVVFGIIQEFKEL